MDEKLTRNVLQAFYSEYQSVYLVDLMQDAIEELYVDSPDYMIRVLSGESYTDFLERVGDLLEISLPQANFESMLGISEIKILLRNRNTNHFEIGNRLFELRVAELRGGKPTKVLLCVKKKNESLPMSEAEEKVHRLPSSTSVVSSGASRHKEAEKSDIFYAVQRDIRTPMNTILGFTNLAASHLDDPERVIDSLNKIRTSSTHLMSLLNNVVDLERIENGNLSFKEEKNNLFTLLMDVRDAIRPQMTSRGLRFEMNTVRLRNRWVYCVQMRISQLLLCLLGSSAEYTPKGGIVTLEVNDYPEKAQEGFTKIEFGIRDNKTTMSEELRKNLMLPYEQADSSVLRKAAGNGLGLSLAKGLVDGMGGKLDFSSAGEKGAVFTVTLQLRIAEQDTAEEISSEKPARSIDLMGGRGDMAIFIEKNSKDKQYNAEESGWIEGKRLLLVEDNELNREIAEDMLIEDGFKVDSVTDGKQAVETVAASAEGYYSAVLMDVQMPVMDGYEATEQIRKLENPELSNIPVIAMTANVLEENEKIAKECGMNAYIAKPVDILTLRYILRRVL